MSRTTQRMIALALLILSAVLAAIIVAKPGSLGLPDVAVAWCAIANLGIGVAVNRLPDIFVSENPRVPPHG